MPRGVPITDEQREQFLALVAQGNTITKAAEALELSPVSFYGRLKNDPEFKQRFEQEARPQFKDRLEQALLAIALGLVKPTHPSQVTALIIALKRYDPDYRESQQRLEITGDGGGPVQIESKGVSLAAIVEWNRAHGVLPDLGHDRPGAALPAPRALLPESGDDQPAAGELPAP